MRPESPDDATIVMFGDGRDWHGRTLLRAFKRRGLTPLLAPLNACGFSSDTATGLAIPGLGDRLPEGAFVRFVPGGSFEEVTLYLGVLHALRELGVTVWNDARAIERCVDKSTTTFFLERAGVPTPRTFAGVNREEA
ncbi:MAG: RimK family alpha-L-glutamate ligase, partial [Methyloceanibacter sp.]|nr:RimK family alpha-L-glutamate ligase [Methyloceanibacter sp.]